MSSVNVDMNSSTDNKLFYPSLNGLRILSVYLKCMMIDTLDVSYNYKSSKSSFV